jgi:hypothetical protein
VNVLAQDVTPGGSGLTVVAVTHGRKGSVTNNGDGTVTYTAQANATGADSFTYTVADGSGEKVTGTVYVTINGLQAWYHFDEGSGPTATDATGHGYTATLQGATWGDGVIGTGLTFDGTSGYATIPPLNLNSKSVTITAWVKPSTAQSEFAGLVFCRAGTTVSGISFGTANELRYTWNDKGATYRWNSGLTPFIGQWTFVALVITPTHATIYMQPEGGKLRHATREVPNAPSAFDGVTDLGQDPLGGRFFNGSMDEVRIYNMALSPAEIAALASPAALTFP